METSRIAELLQPFVESNPRPDTARPAKSLPGALTQLQLEQIATYIELLLRWNKRINLTAVRQSEHIVTRHFGESFFLAFHSGLCPGWKVADLGSGAGFPGLPLKISVPGIGLTLIESNHKKATFLREVIRTLGLSDADVFGDRAEKLVATADFHPRVPGGTSIPRSDGPELARSKLAGFPARLVTLRAVEHFEDALRTAAQLSRSGNRGATELALLISKAQAGKVPNLISGFRWNAPIPVPLSRERVLLLGTSEG